MTAISKGPELSVNTYTESEQSLSAIAMDADGDFVITWRSYNQDGDGSGIFAQRYNSTGIAQGSEFQVNTYTQSGQNLPAIAMDNRGNFVVVWRSYYQSPTDAQGGIFAQRYDSFGNPQGQEFHVNSTTEGFQTSPDIAMDADGDFVVIWEGPDNDGIGIFVQRYDSSGQKQGGEFLANTTETGFQSESSVAMDASGNFIVVWEQQKPNGMSSIGDGIFAQRFDSNGNKQGEEFEITTPSVDFQGDLGVAMDADGNVVVAWQSFREDMNKSGIYARRYDQAGIAQGAEFAITTYEEDFSNEFAIDMDADGNFVVAWESLNLNGESEGIYAKRFNDAGTPIQSRFHVNPRTPVAGYNPALAVDQQGNFVISWDSIRQDGDREGVYAQRYQLVSTIEFSQPFYQINENGRPAGTTVTLNRLDDLHLTSQVQVNVTGGTATAGTDYSIASPINLTFNPGETSKTVNIPILQDEQIEGIESIFFHVNGLDRAVIGNQRTAVLAILDDDIPGNQTPGGDDSTDTPLIRGTNRKDRLTGTNADETLVGLGKSDRIRARGGDDILIGVNPNSRRPGRRERDKLIGNGGDDLFVLGDERKVFYNDGRRKSAGLKDYALIKGFNKRQDTIQLHGKAKDYVLGSSLKGKGVGLFLEGKEDELIAVIRGNTNNLRFNSNAFEFV